MSLLSRRIAPYAPQVLAIVLVMAGLCDRVAAADSEPSPSPADIAPGLLRSFEEIWALPAPAQRVWHRVRLEYTIYHYDPLWMALWGRSGEAESYLSLGARRFPLHPGQRILVQGLMQPAKGMRVEQPEVQVLAENVGLEPLRTAGQVARTELFNKRLVLLDAYVDRQQARDANHVELALVSEGRAVLGQLFSSTGDAVPQLQGRLVRAKGVYFARSDAQGGEPVIELWIQGSQDVQVFEPLDADPRFAAPTKSWAELERVAPGDFVHVSGVVQSAEPRTGVTIGLDGHAVQVLTPQHLAVRAGDPVEAIGALEQDGTQRIVRRALVRPVQEVFTSVPDLWRLSEADRRERRRVRLDWTVYYYDPAWKALWGRAADSDSYVTLADPGVPIRAGQRILLEGYVVPANGMIIEEPKITVLDAAVRIEATPIRGNVGDVDRFQRRYVAVEGLVDRQQTLDRRHLLLDLVVDGRIVLGRVLLDEGAEMPNWLDARVRLRGVYSATQDPTGATPAIEIWSQGLANVEVLGSIARDERFERAATPIERLSALEPGTIVKVAGAARGQQSGRLFVRDETGQLTVHSPQGRSVPPGSAVEAVGRLVRDGVEMSLADALFRRSQAAPPPPATALPKLRLADQIRELEPEEAAKGYPVQLSGIVTWARPNADFFYMNDSSGGVCVLRPPGTALLMYGGTKVELTGVSAVGRFAPVVLASAVQTSATIDLPEARPVTLEQALTGVEEAQWVSMSGYVRGISTEAPWTRFDLTTSAGDFVALVPPNERLARLVGAIVRVRGVCAAVANDKRQLTGIRVWVPSHRFVDVEEEPPADPFATALRPIASLRQFGTLQAMNRRVRVAGIVVHQSGGRVVHLQETGEGLLVVGHGGEELRPGDRVEAVGFPGREHNRVVLREAVFRRIARGAEPAPVRLARVLPVDTELDSRLVRVEGTLLNVSGRENGIRLLIQQRDAVIDAALESEAPELLTGWKDGSRVAVTGVCEVRFDEYRRPHGLRLLLRTPADLAVLQKPSWWTARRALLAAAVPAIGVVLGFIWVIALRRRVRQQTAVIRQQVESERAARLEAALARASKLESLGVLAGGIAHDFNNLLTVVLGNLSLARLDTRVPSDTHQCLAEGEQAATRARELTQQLLTFAKGGEPIKTSARLPELVREAAVFGLHGSKVRCDFDFASDLWPALVDRGQTAQVVHNLILNANQAMPDGGVVTIRLRNEEITAPRAGLAVGRYVKLTVCDAGNGIPAENLSRIFEPYFTTKQQGNGLGLATVYSIVKRHQGHVEVTSQTGRGTTFDVWLPATEAAPAAEPSAPTGTAAPVGRVLLMDDEPSIRSLATAVFRRMGVAAVVVEDGAAAVEAYAKARDSGQPFDLVILDLTVPGGMGGLDAMRRLREIDPKVRAIVSSGYSKDPVMAHHADYGFCGRVPKPYQASELMSAVRAALPPSPH